jgi:jumonji domain-containing protein 7
LGGKITEYIFFREKIGSKDVTVTVTPNGYADAVIAGKFVMPEERCMKFANFLDIMEKKSNPAGVYYVQKQNSNFTDEFRDIAVDASLEIPWASEAFGELSRLPNSNHGAGNKFRLIGVIYLKPVSGGMVYF